MSKYIHILTHTHTHTPSLSSIHLHLRHASSAKLHTEDRLPHASAPREMCHRVASCSLQAQCTFGLTVIQSILPYCCQIRWCTSQNKAPHICVCVCGADVVERKNCVEMSPKHTPNIHYCSKVWDHPDNFVSSMKNHTFIFQMNIKYSQDIDKVRNND